MSDGKYLGSNKPSSIHYRLRRLARSPMTLADGSTGGVERRTISKDSPRDYPDRGEGSDENWDWYQEIRYSILKKGLENQQQGISQGSKEIERRRSTNQRKESRKDVILYVSLLCSSKIYGSFQSISSPMPKPGSDTTWSAPVPWWARSHPATYS